MSSLCPEGQIRRKAFSYTRRDGTHVKVKSTCIKDAGKKGKTPSRRRWSPKVKKGGLSGWGKYKSDRSRHEALNKHVKSDGYATIMRRLNWLKNVTADTETKARAKEDIKYLQQRYRAPEVAGFDMTKAVPIIIVVTAGLLAFAYIKNRQNTQV